MLLLLLLLQPGRACENEAVRLRERENTLLLRRRLRAQQAALRVLELCPQLVLPRPR